MVKKLKEIYDYTHQGIVQHFCLFCVLVGSEEYYFALDVAKKQGEKFGLCYTHRRVVSSVGRAPVCRAGGRGFKPRPDQNSGSLNN